MCCLASYGSLGSPGHPYLNHGCSHHHPLALCYHHCMEFVYGGPSHHPIQYCGKEGMLDIALSDRKHCHEREDIEGHGCSSLENPENLPRGQCHPRHSSMHMGNGLRQYCLPYLSTCFSHLCILPLCLG